MNKQKFYKKVTRLTKRSGSPYYQFSFYDRNEKRKRISTGCTNIEEAIIQAYHIQETYKISSVNREIKIQRDDDVKFESGFVYFLKLGRLVKIGKSNGIHSRIASIKASLPFETEIIAVLKCKNKTIVEQIFHEYFQDKRKKGEWFRLDKEDIELIKIANKLKFCDEFARDLLRNSVCDSVTSNLPKIASMQIRN